MINKGVTMAKPVAPPPLEVNAPGGKIMPPPPPPPPSLGANAPLGKVLPPSTHDISGVVKEQLKTKKERQNLLQR